MLPKNFSMGRRIYCALFASDTDLTLSTSTMPHAYLCPNPGPILDITSRGIPQKTHRRVAQVTTPVINVKPTAFLKPYLVAIEVGGLFAPAPSMAAISSSLSGVTRRR